MYLQSFGEFSAVHIFMQIEKVKFSPLEKIYGLMTDKIKFAILFLKCATQGLYKIFISRKSSILFVLEVVLNEIIQIVICVHSET